MSRQFTTEAEKALNKAAKFAIRMGQRIVGSEHLLFGLSAAPGVAAKVLKENGMDKERLDIEVREYCGMSDVVEIEPLRGASGRDKKIAEEITRENAVKRDWNGAYAVGNFKRHVMCGV